MKTHKMAYYATNMKNSNLTEKSKGQTSSCIKNQYSKIAKNRDSRNCKKPLLSKQKNQKGTKNILDYNRSYNKSNCTINKTFPAQIRNLVDRYGAKIKQIKFYIIIAVANKL
jgi:hypothetical protein